MPISAQNSPSSHQPLRLAIVGAGGRLGAVLAEHFGVLKGYAVQTFDRGQLNLATPHALPRALEKVECDVLINTAAYTAVDDCESQPSHALLVNGSAPGELARWCASRGVKMVHFSTDYVFDGQQEIPYKETDAPNPQSAYGRSKLVGEEQVLAASDRHLVLRLSWLFGGSRPAFPEWVLRHAASGQVSVVKDKTGCPTYAPDVAQWLEALLELRSPCGGIFHLCNPTSCTWLEWAQEVLTSVGSKIIPEGINLSELPGLSASRPKHSALDVAKFKSFTSLRCRPWQEAVREHLRRRES